MLTVKPYNEGNLEYGNVYTVTNRSKYSISIERNEASARYATAYIVNVKGANDERICFTLDDEEMQEFMLGYLAVKKEIEEG